MPHVLGLSHVMLTVTDLAAARRFWAEVLGFEVAVDREHVVICVDAGSRVSIGCLRHPDGMAEPFDERRVGLDHLALQVADLPTLQAWEQRLAAHDVVRSPLVESAWGWHLNARGPENLALELNVTRPEVLDALYGEPGSAQERLARLAV